MNQNVKRYCRPFLSALASLVGFCAVSDGPGHHLSFFACGMRTLRVKFTVT